VTQFCILLVFVVTRFEINCTNTVKEWCGYLRFYFSFFFIEVFVVMI
jgi:hypothetical protein